MTGFQAPDLYLLGTNRCGTTSVWRFFEGHPDCCTSMPKDPYFFERASEYALGVGHLGQRYYSTWDNHKSTLFCRETSLMLPWAMPRILETSPKAKFIVTVRPPVSRFFSQWAWRTVRGIEKRAFPDVVDQALSRWSEKGNVFGDLDTEVRWEASLCENPRSTTFDYYLESGLYVDNLTPWFNAAGKERFLLLNISDLADHPEATAQKLCAFADLDYSRGLTVVPSTNSWSTFSKQPWASGATPVYDADAAARLKTFYDEPETRLQALWSTL